MAEKMAERIAEILKEPNFQTAEKALTDFCGPMDGEFRNLLVEIIVKRWIDTPKDVPFSYARSIWNRKDINREEYQALLEEIRSYPIAPINKAKISDFLWVVENDFSDNVEHRKSPQPFRSRAYRTLTDVLEFPSGGEGGIQV